MRLEDLDRKALFEMAKHYGVETKYNDSKVALIEALREDGITDSDIKQPEPEEDVQVAASQVSASHPAVVAGVADPFTEVPAVPTKTLIVMTRKNPSYETEGLRFERSNPFQLVDTKLADHLIENVGGFRVASPKEAADFYS